MRKIPLSLSIYRLSTSLVFGRSVIAQMGIPFHFRYKKPAADHTENMMRKDSNNSHNNNKNNTPRHNPKKNVQGCKKENNKT